MKLQLYFTVEQKIVRIICEYMVFLIQNNLKLLNQELLI